MLKLKDFTPINRDEVKARWDEIMNIPNDQWNILGVDQMIKVINDPEYPATLRTVKLNTIPALVIEIIKEKKQA